MGGNGSTVTVANGSEIGIVESSAYPSDKDIFTNEDEATIEINGAFYIGGRGLLSARRGTVMVRAPRISTYYEGGHEIRVHNGENYKFYPTQPHGMKAREYIGLYGDTLDIRHSTFRTGGGLYLYNLTSNPSIVETNGSILSAGDSLVINIGGWSGRTTTEYVGSMVQVAPWFMMQTLTAACNRGVVEVGRKLFFNVYKLFFHDDAERQLMASGPLTYSTYDTFEPRMQTVIPSAPQAPQMSKKDMMRALGMGGFGTFFSGGNLPNIGFHGHFTGAGVAMPAAPGLSFNVACSMQVPGFEMSTWHGGPITLGGLTPSFTSVKSAEIMDQYRICGGMGQIIKNGPALLKAFQKAQKGAGKGIDVLKAAVKAATGGMPPDDEEGKKGEVKYPNNPKESPQSFRPLESSGAKKNMEDGSIWERDTSSHGGEQWKRWDNQRAWERGEKPTSVWPDGRVRK